MKCPYCGESDTKVIDSRPMEENNSIRRRRSCDKCGKRFTTFEKVEVIPLMVIKKDNNREPFDRAKIEGGISRACHKRPVSTPAMDAAIDRIENEVYAMDVRELESSKIGEMVMAELKQLDEVAYVRFASVYREFRDVNSFLEELEKLYRK